MISALLVPALLIGFPAGLLGAWVFGGDAGGLACGGLGACLGMWLSARWWT